MIDFRYFIVSIVAIFMALAVGIALGSGPLKSPIDSALAGQTDQLRAEKRQLQDQVSRLEGQLADSATYATVVGPLVNADRLSGYSVVTVALPGADAGVTEQTTAALAQAGAHITGAVSVTDAWTDPAQADVLGRLAEGLAPPGLALPSGLTPAQRAAAVLASALQTRDRQSVGVATPASTAVLSGFRQAGFIGYDSPPTRADLAVVLSAKAPAEVTGTTTSDNAALLPIPVAMDARGRGVVVGGPTGSDAPGGFVAAVRESAASDNVSTVDVDDTDLGRSLIVLALQEQVDGGVGQYGFGAGTTAVAPAQPKTGP